MRVGVLSLQGSFREHFAALARLGVTAVEVRTPNELETVRGLVIPGGESTTLGKLLKSSGLMQAVKTKAQEGFPIYGTCAGAILLAEEIENSQGVEGLGLLPITVARNAYGNQLESFVTDLTVTFSAEKVEAVFIRAPKIREPQSPTMQVLARYEGEPVLVRQGSLLASTFHPELTAATTVHAYWLTLFDLTNRD